MASYKSLVNIVEDARIEKMIQAKFPGLSRNFYDGYSELMDRNFFGLNGRDVNDLNLIDRINIHFKIGTRAGVEFTDEEQVFVDRIAKLRNFDETITIADELLEYCEDNQSETDMDDYSFESDDGTEDDSDDEYSDSYPSTSGDTGEVDDTDQEDDGETSDEPAEDSNSDAPTDADESDNTAEGNNSVESKDDSDSDDSDDDIDDEERIECSVHQKVASIRHLKNWFLKL